MYLTRFGWLALCLSPALLLGQLPNIKLDAAIPGMGYNPCEPSIAINMAHPDTIVAGAILNRVYYSHDGGATWQKSSLSSPYGVFGDPCLVSDYRGNVYYLHLSDPSGMGWAHPSLLDRIVCQRSADGGVTWTPGGYMGYNPPRDQDKEWMTVNPLTGHLYTTWTQFDKYDSRDTADKSHIYFARSTNLGKKWSKAVRISQLPGDCLDDDHTTEGAVPAAGPGGELYVAWALDEKIYFDRSRDQGKTWLDTDRIAATQPGGWTLSVPGISRCNGLPVTVCDISTGPYRGSVYVHWADQRHGPGDTDIWVAASRDGGDTWTGPIRINQDSSRRHQFLSWMTVDPATGYLYCVYYDRQHHTDLQTDVTLAWSVDGGQHWQNKLISETPFVPASEYFFGDYCHISAYKGRIFPIWTRMDQGNTSIWTAAVRAAALGITP
ncbi:MAG: sialidase family protein [Bacteroidia bacterium]|nr:sialidase family protein [Bacteroidia bacterium]